jgi:hypothetical protein
MRVDKEKADFVTRNNMTPEDLSEEQAKQFHEDKKSAMLKKQMGGFASRRNMKLKSGRSSGRANKNKEERGGERYRAVREMIAAKKMMVDTADRREAVSQREEEELDTIIELDKAAAKKREEEEAAKSKEEEEEAEKRKEERWQLLIKAEEAAKKREDEVASKAVAKWRAASSKAAAKKKEDAIASCSTRDEKRKAAREKREKAAVKDAAAKKGKGGGDAAAAAPAETAVGAGGTKWLSEEDLKRQQRTSRLLGRGSTQKSRQRNATKEQVVFTTKISKNLYSSERQKVRPSAARPSLCPSDGRFSLASTIAGDPRSTIAGGPRSTIAAFDEDEEDSYLTSMFEGMSAGIAEEEEQDVPDPATAHAPAPAQARKTMRFSLAFNTLPVADDDPEATDASEVERHAAERASWPPGRDFDVAATRKRSASLGGGHNSRAGESARLSQRPPRRGSALVVGQALSNEGRRLSQLLKNKRLSQKKDAFSLDVGGGLERQESRPRINTHVVNTLVDVAAMAEAEAAVRSSARSLDLICLPCLISSSYSSLPIVLPAPFV